MVTVKKTAGRPAKAATMSKREQLQQIHAALSAEQEDAIKEAHDYFSGPTMLGHLKMIERLQDSAVPGEIFDQLMRNNLTVVNSTAEWLAQWVNRPKVAEGSIAAQP